MDLFYSTISVDWFCCCLKICFVDGVWVRFAVSFNSGIDDWLICCAIVLGLAVVLLVVATRFDGFVILFAMLLDGFDLGWIVVMLVLVLVGTVVGLCELVLNWVMGWT